MTQKQYFGTDGIRGKVGESLINPSFVLKLGWAIGKILGDHQGKKVIIGKDTRISGYMLESALEAGLAAAGMDIRLLGPMPTPAIAYLTRTFRACAGVVISASHNSFSDNGLKFFGRDGFKLPDELELKIEKQLDEPMETVDASQLGKAFRINDAPGRYIEFCKSTLKTSLSLQGLKIVLDCANGATYHIAPSVFKELGAEIHVIANEPDGFNINSHCGSTHPELLQEKVRELSADVGISFDGDGDRVIMVDHQGEVVDGDELLFIIARRLQKLGKRFGGVIGTSMSNLGLENALKQHQIPFERTQVGDRYVMEALRKKGWEIGGESSGHIINLHLSTTGDGIISAVQVLSAIVEEQRSLNELKSDMQKYPQIMINVPIKQPVNINQEAVKEAVSAAESQLGAQGRVLLRPSGTEPVVRVMVEGEQLGEITKVAEELASVVGLLK